MLLLALAEVSRSVAATRSRKAKIQLLGKCLEQAAATQDGRVILLAVLFLCGELRQGRIGVGPSLLCQLRVEQSNDDALRVECARLTLVDVDDALAEIAAVSGQGANRRRLDLVVNLFARAGEIEREFLFKLLLGDLGQGALEGVLLEAIADAASVPSERVREAAMLGGELAKVAVSALLAGEEELSQYQLEVGRPLQPMLAQSEDSIDAALKKIIQSQATSADAEAALVEWKLDGARVQVHRKRDDVHVFSRELNDVTAAVPEVVERVLGLGVDEIVLDGEVIALQDDGRPKPFQETMRRFGRHRNVEEMRERIPLSVQFFDLLLVNGEPFLEKPYGQRAQKLREILPPGLQIPFVQSNDVALASEFFESALGMGHEGVVVKDANAAYQAGRRGYPWIKVKRAKTLDLVVLAAEWGSGRRQGWLSNLHLGALEPETGSFVMLGKTFKGMTDTTLQWQTSALLERERAREGRTVFVHPELVVEIALDGVQRSKQYPGGVAIRFARLVRYRTDKSAREIDTIDAVKAMFPSI